MRTKEFEVPVEVIKDFAELIEEHELSNEILGLNEDGDLRIEISYEKDDREALMNLMELIDDFYEEETEEEEEEENEG